MCPHGKLIDLNSRSGDAVIQIRLDLADAGRRCNLKVPAQRLGRYLHGIGEILRPQPQRSVRSEIAVGGRVNGAHPWSRHCRNNGEVVNTLRKFPESEKGYLEQYDEWKKR